MEKLSFKAFATYFLREDNFGNKNKQHKNQASEDKTHEKLLHQHR
jgi:hypothetical protein